MPSRSTGSRASSSARPSRVLEGLALEGIERAYLLIVNTDRPGRRRRPASRGRSEGWSRRVGGRIHPLPLVKHRPLRGRPRGGGRPITTCTCLTTTPPPGVRFYSGSDRRALRGRSRVGGRLDPGACAPRRRFPGRRSAGLTMPTASVAFVEVGPGASCTRMIGEILEGAQPHLAISACPCEREPDRLVLLGRARQAGRRPISG